MLKIFMRAVVVERQAPKVPPWLANETVCITTSETNFDPIVYVREADCNMGQEAACNDDDRDFDIAPGVFDQRFNLIPPWALRITSLWMAVANRPVIFNLI